MMPIRPEYRALYPADWRDVSLSIRETRAGWRCEWMDCAARHGEAHPLTGSRVVLTVMHLDHDPTNNEPENLRAACQRCHNRYDMAHRRANAARRRDCQMMNAVDGDRR